MSLYQMAAFAMLITFGKAAIFESVTNLEGLWKPSQPDKQVKKGKCPFGFGSTVDDSEVSLLQVRPSHIQYSNQLFLGGIEKTESMSKDTYEQLVHATIEIYEDLEKTVDDNRNERAKFAGCLIRQAGHDFMDYRSDNSSYLGGSDGCINYDDPDNKGLYECSTKFGIDKLYTKWNKHVSLADYLVIIAEAILGRVATDNFDRVYNKDQHFRSGTYAQHLRDTFKYGRKTAKECSWTIGRMPNPEHACEGKGPGKDGLKQIFVDNIYRDAEYPWTMTAAISGAHTIGSASIENSGYNGFWSDAKNSGIFNNDYYKSALMRGWMPEKGVNGNSEKNQWQISDIRKDDAHKVMMLTTDLCLVFKNNYNQVVCQNNSAAENAKTIGWQDARMDCIFSFFGTGVDLDPREANCCAWIKATPFLAWRLTHDELCGVPWKTMGGDLVNECCSGMGKKWPQILNCDHKYHPTGVAFEDYMDFAKNESLWLKEFAKAWHMANENGQDLNPLDSDADQAIKNKIKQDESTICTDMKHHCWKRSGCRKSLFELTPEFMQQFRYRCVNQNKPQSNQRKELAKLPSFEKVNTWTRGYSGNMNPWTVQYRSLLTLTAVNAKSFLYHHKNRPDWVLHRQNGWQTVIDKEYFDSHSRPYDFGVRSWQYDSKWTKSSLFMSKKGWFQWWLAKFVEGVQTIQEVRIKYPVPRSKQMHGVKVFIDWHLCGTIDTSSKGPWAKTGDRWAGFYKIQCNIKGSTILIVKEHWGDLHLSDVQVHASLDGLDGVKI